MKIGVISDTHGVLREEVISELNGCDYIIHAGDIGGEEIIKRLESIAKTFAVRGNNDGDEWGRRLPYYKEIEIDEVLIYVVHNKDSIPDNLREVDLVIYGHSHKYSEERIGDTVFLNPGACGRKRFSLPLTMAILEVNLDRIDIKKVNIE